MNAMEKSCPSVESLARWVEGSLSAQERSRLESHLAVCDDCRRSVAIASDLEAPAARSLNEALLSKVVSASRRRRLLPVAAAAAGLLVAVGVAFAIFRKTPEAAPPPALAERRLPDRALPAPDLPVRKAPRAQTPAPAPIPPTAPAADRSRAPQPAPPAAAPERPNPVPKHTQPADKPEPPVPAPEAVEAAKEPPAPAAPPADPKTLAPVLALDPAGDLWLRRDHAESKAGVREQMNWQDLFAARSAAASFSLEARASVVLEKGSEVALSHLKADDSYSLAIGQGLVMLDTEGSTQRWRIAFGPNEVHFSELNGRLAVESKGDRVSALLLEGTAELKIGASATKALVGQEVVLSRAGQVVGQKVETQKKLARLSELRPRVFCAFATTFDDKKDDPRLYPFALVTGRLAQRASGPCLEAELEPAKAGEKPTVRAEVRLGRAFGMVTGMALRFRYRSALPKLTVKIGKYSVEYPSRVRAGQWVEAEIPLREFSFEGTPMLPTDPVESVQFSGVPDRRGGLLDIGGVQFLRRGR